MIWPTLLLFPLCLASNIKPLPNIRSLAQFPNNTWIENVAVRSNGLVLVTLVTSPEIYQIDPFELNPKLELVATFPDAEAVLGIQEIEEDVFAITKGNFSIFTGHGDARSWSVWKVDFRHRILPLISRIADVPEAMFLNGITTVREGSDIVLIADSVGGVIWRLNVKTASYDVVLNTTATQPIGTVLTGGFGVNGVHTRGGFLYFTNTNLGFFRVPVHRDGTIAGAVEELAEFIRGDDFTFDPEGTAYVARGAVDLISKVFPDGSVVPLQYENTDGVLLEEGNTGIQFGRMKKDRRTLYVSTNGGLSGLVNGTYVQGGRLLAIHLDGNCK